MTVELLRTAAPGVFLSPSEKTPGTYYSVSNIPSPFVMCNCTAARHGRECKHVIAGLELSAALMEEEEKSVSEEQMTTAVALAQRSATVVRAEEQRLRVASHLAAWNDLKQLAQEHIATGFAPKDVTTPAQGGLILLKALELDIPITAAYEFVAVIHGRPKLMGQMVDALVSRSGKGYIHVIESDSQGCTAEGVRPGRKSIRIRFTVEDAQRANLMTNDSWKKFPADHCRWKAITRVGRVMFADVLGGMDVVDAGGQVIDSTAVEVGEGEATGRLIVADAETGKILSDAVEGEYRDAEETAATPARAPDSARKGATPADDSGEQGGLSDALVPAWMEEWNAARAAAGLVAADRVHLAGVMGVSPGEVMASIGPWLAAEKGRSIKGLVSGAVDRKIAAAEGEGRR